MPMCVGVLCCRARVGIRLMYMLDPTILFMYGGDDSAVSNCEDVVVLL